MGEWKAAAGEICKFSVDELKWDNFFKVEMKWETSMGLCVCLLLLISENTEDRILNRLQSSD